LEKLQRLFSRIRGDVLLLRFGLELAQCGQVVFNFLKRSQRRLAIGGYRSVVVRTGNIRIRPAKTVVEESLR
jgi:hypothetical protein